MKSLKINTLRNISLVPLRLKHAEIFMRLVHANAEELQRHFPITSAHTQTLRATNAYLKTKEKMRAARKWDGYLVMDNAEETLMGYVEVKNMEWSVPKGELAYFINKAHQGKGIGSEAVRQLVTFCFKELNLNKLHVMVAEENEASRRLALTCGFTQEGFLKKEIRMNTGELMNVYLFGKLND